MTRLFTPSLATALLLLLGAGCKTSGSSGVKDDGAPARSCYSKFEAPDGSGEAWEVWGNATSSEMSDVRLRYSDGRDPSPATQDIGNAPHVDQGAMLQNGMDGMREYMKSPVHFNSHQFDCYDISSSYFCLASDLDQQGLLNTMWITTQGFLKFAHDLTVYRSTCTTAP